MCVARRLKDRVDVPLAAIRQILRLALRSMLQPVEKYIEHITYIVIILISIHVQLVGKFARLKGRFRVVSKLERHRLAVHEYCESDSIRTIRQMTDVYFVDFIELRLKSKDDFSAAFDIVLSTNLAEYLKRFLIFQPGDWPAQLYSRQIIYETLQRYYCTSDTAQCVISTPTDHEYATPFTSVHSQEAQVREDNVSTSVSQPAILSVIPCIGPLPISLNGRETVFKEFMGFFRNIYTKLFPRSKLRKSPTPWRISVVLQIVYSGWLFIRDTVKEKFKV